MRPTSHTRSDDKKSGSFTTTNFYRYPELQTNRHGVGRAPDCIHRQGHHQLAPHPLGDQASRDSTGRRPRACRIQHLPTMRSSRGGGEPNRKRNTDERSGRLRSQESSNTRQRAWSHSSSAFVRLTDGEGRGICHFAPRHVTCVVLLFVFHRSLERCRYPLRSPLAISEALLSEECPNSSPVKKIGTIDYREDLTWSLK